MVKESGRGDEGPREAGASVSLIWGAAGGQWCGTVGVSGKEDELEITS